MLSLGNFQTNQTTKAFEKICTAFGKPDIDLFASRLNYQCKPFVAWKPDPEAKAIDAFTVNWGEYTNVYIFPPFSLLNKVLQKMAADGAQGLLWHRIGQPRPGSHTSTE